MHEQCVVILYSVKSMYVYLRGRVLRTATLGVLLVPVLDGVTENMFGAVGVAAPVLPPNAAVGAPPKLNPAGLLSVLACAEKLNPPVDAAGVEPNAAGDGWGRPFWVAVEPNVGVEALLLLPKEGFVLLLPNTGVELALPKANGVCDAGLVEVSC